MYPLSHQSVSNICVVLTTHPPVDAWFAVLTCLTIWMCKCLLGWGLVRFCLFPFRCWWLWAIISLSHQVEPGSKNSSFRLFECKFFKNPHPSSNSQVGMHILTVAQLSLLVTLLTLNATFKLLLLMLPLLLLLLSFFILVNSLVTFILSSLILLCCFLNCSKGLSQF